MSLKSYPKCMALVAGLGVMLSGGCASYGGNDEAEDSLQTVRRVLRQVGKQLQWSSERLHRIPNASLFLELVGHYTKIE